VRVSKVTDVITLRTFGKSVIGVWRRTP
jgi:hypothetical protein